MLYEVYQSTDIVLRKVKGITNAASWDVIPFILVNAIVSEVHTTSTSTVAP